MQLGVILLPGPDASVLVSRARLAADRGFSCIGVGDVPGPDGELFVALGALAGSGVPVSIGPMVTNPVSRHAAVTAAAIAAVGRAHPAGAFLGLGRGGSPLASMGLTRPTTDELAAACRQTRDALDRLSSDVPLHLSAYGPATLQTAGKYADGVIIAGGTSVGYLRASILAVREAASSAGRVPSDIQISVLARMSIAATRAEAVRPLRANLASAGANNLRAPEELAQIPAAIRAQLDQLRRRYDSRPDAHVSVGSPNVDLIDELELTDFLADRFAIAGTTAEVRSRLDDYEALGVTTVWAPAVESSPELAIERLSSLAR